MPNKTHLKPEKILYLSICLLISLEREIFRLCLYLELLDFFQCTITGYWHDIQIGLVGKRQRGSYYLKCPDKIGENQGKLCFLSSAFKTWTRHEHTFLLRIVLKFRTEKVYIKFQRKPTGRTTGNWDRPRMKVFNIKL